jgi:hypothetical protein
VVGASVFELLAKTHNFHVSTDLVGGLLNLEMSNTEVTRLLIKASRELQISEIFIGQPK